MRTHADDAPRSVWHCTNENSLQTTHRGQCVTAQMRTHVDDAPRSVWHCANENALQTTHRGQCDTAQMRTHCRRRTEVSVTQHKWERTADDAQRSVWHCTNENALQTTHKWWHHTMAAAARCDVTEVKCFINSPDTEASLPSISSIYQRWNS